MTKKTHFKAFFKGARRIQNQFITLYYAKTYSDEPKAAFVGQKKEMKSAVKRNRGKRLLREYYRLNRDKIGACDVVMIPKRQFYTLPKFKDIEEIMDQLVTKKINGNNNDK